MIDHNNSIPRRSLLKKSVIAIPAYMTAESLIADEKPQSPTPSSNPEKTLSEKPAIEHSESPLETEIKLKMASIQNQFGKHLNEQQSEIVRMKVSAVVQGSGFLRNQKLDVFDGPWSVFHPIRQQSDTAIKSTSLKSSISEFETASFNQASPVNDPAFATIFQLATGLRSGKFTSPQLTEFFLERLEKYGPKLNCIATLTKDLAMKQAKAADARIRSGQPLSILDGIPFGAKDLLSASGYPTSFGCAPYLNRVLDRDATVIRKLTEAGAVLVAKTAMVECAGGLGYRQANASAFGPGLTPYDTTRWSGGSSSGSGSAVAAGLLPFAIGSETWGSITTPSSYCGLTGLRPTYGRVSRAGAFALAYSLDKIGPMARTAAETMAILRIMSGQDADDPSSQDMAWFGEETPEPKPYRLAVIKDGVANAQPEVKKNFENALDIFRNIAEIEEIEIPNGPYAEILLTILSAESSSALEELVSSGLVQQLTAPEDRIGGYANRTILAMDYIRAQRLRGPLCRSFDEYLRPFDAILTIPTATTAPPVAQNFGARNTLKNLGGPGNLSGSPAIVLPSGLDQNGLPTSIQLDSRVGNELTLVRLGQYFQSKTTWHLQRPDLSKI